MTSPDPLADPVFALMDQTASRHPKALTLEENACLRLWDAILALRARVTQLESEVRRLRGAPGLFDPPPD